MKFYDILQPIKPMESTEAVNITNLTAEIESFVRESEIYKEQIENTKKSENNKSTQSENKDQGMCKILRQSPESNEYYPQEEGEINMEKIKKLGSTDVNSNKRSKTSPIKILIRAPTDEESPTVDEELESTSNVHLKDDHGPKHPKHVVFEQESAMEEKNDINSKAIDNKKKSKEKEKKSVELIENVEESTTPTSSAVEFILEHEKSADNILYNPTALKATKSVDDFTKVKSNNNIQNITKDDCSNNNKQVTIFSRFEMGTIPLKFESPRMRKKNSDEDNFKNETPTPPQRRRSVKEIIESINKCQSLLKVNQEKAPTSSSKSFKNNNMDRNMNDSGEKQYKSKRMFSDIAEVNNNIPLVLEKFNMRNNDGAIDESVSNVDWNPVPKPRRHHKNSTQGSIN